MGSAWLVTPSGRMRTVFKIWLNINFIKGAVKHYSFRLSKFCTHSRIPKIKLQLLKIECLPCIIYASPHLGYMSFLSAGPTRRIWKGNRSAGGSAHLYTNCEVPPLWLEFFVFIWWWAVPSLGLNSISNLCVIPSRKRNRKSPLSLAWAQSLPPTLGRLHPCLT